MGPVDHNILDACKVIARQRPEKDMAFWGWKHPDGRLFVTLMSEVSDSCWSEGMDEISESDLSQYFTNEDFGS